MELGKYGIENMDYKYHVQDLIENEPQLFCKKGNKYSGLYRFVVK